MVAIIGGSPERFAPYVYLYRRATDTFGTTAHPVGMRSPGFIADTDEEARELHWRHDKVIRDRVGALRGWPPVRKEEYGNEIEHGSLYIGSPETVARSMADAIKALDVGRFDLIHTTGAQPISARLCAVELYGTQVLPMVRDLLAGWHPERNRHDQHRHRNRRHPGPGKGRHRARTAGPCGRLPRAHRRLGRRRRWFVGSTARPVPPAKP
jgi:hypothetical protein